LNTPKTVISIQQLCETHSYPDQQKVADEASKANILIEVAGIPHVYLEEWEKHIQRAAATQRSARKKTNKSIADTDQLGIINSNLKRLPESIRIKERKLRAKQALYKDAATDNEKYILSGEISKLKNELKIHKENLEKAQKRQKQILAQRATELKALESQNKEPDESEETKNSSE
jgi:hypothetical protein